MFVAVCVAVGGTAVFVAVAVSVDGTVAVAVGNGGTEQFTSPQYRIPRSLPAAAYSEATGRPSPASTSDSVSLLTPAPPRGAARWLLSSPPAHAGSLQRSTHVSKNSAR